MPNSFVEYFAFVNQQRKEQEMASYVVLFQFTDQGIRTVKETTRRAAAAANIAKKFGIKVTDVFWTLGAYDGLLLMEAPNDEAVAAFSVSAGSLGNIRSQTLRAFRAKEFDKILAKLK